MKKVISKILIAVMVLTMVGVYQSQVDTTVTSYADEGETTTVAEETTTQAPEETTTVPETTTKPEKITPAKVTKLKASNIKNTSVKLNWKKSKNATKYLVYCSKEKKNGKMTKYSKIDSTTKTSVIDVDLKQGTFYKYKVVAYRVADGYTTKSAGVVVKVLTKLDNVKSFKATAKSSSVKLSWKKNAKASKYYIYKANESGNSYGAFKKIKTVSKKKATCTVSKLTSGKSYKFKIVVYRKKSGVKALSSGKTTTAMTTLSAPSNVRTKEGGKQITIKWNKVKSADKYEVYRGNKKLKTTTGTSYTKKGLKIKHTYTFKIRAVRKYKGKTYRSTFTTVKAATTTGMKGTWIEVSIKTQTMRMYVKNKLYCKTAVVTGNVGDRHTSKGVHHVLQKNHPRRLQGSYHGQKWDVTVNYWLGFTSDGQGIHDSTWRSAYGGNIYKHDGSHGCVNTPLGKMRKIYKKAYVGMPVVVY